MPNLLILEALKNQLESERAALWSMAHADASGYKRRGGETEEIVGAYIDTMTAKIAKINELKATIAAERERA